MLIFTACGGDSDDAPEAEATPTAVVTQAETQVVEEPTPTAIIVTGKDIKANEHLICSKHLSVTKGAMAYT